MAGYIGSKASVVSSGAERKKTFAITTSTTSLTGLVYTPTKVHVFHNGVRLVDGTDYTATNSTSITLTVAAESGDQVVVVSYASFQTSDTVSASAGGTFAGRYITVTGSFTSQGIDDNANATAITIDSSESVFIGKTSENIGVAGMQFLSSGLTQLTATGQPLYLNRLGSDGQVMDFRKDGTAVGSIGSNTTSGQTLLDLTATQNFRLLTNGSERMRIDSSGNVGIGVTPTSLLTLGTTVPQINFVDSDAPSAYARILGTANGSLFISADEGNAAANSSIIFETDTTARMRVDSSGSVLVGTTSANQSGGIRKFVSYDTELAGLFKSDTAGSETLSVHNTATSGTRRLILFKTSSGNGTSVGEINTNGSSTAYNTSSDYRLKTDAQLMTGASARVQALNPVNFEWIADGTRVDGFLAHEAQAVVPESVTGTKDAMRDEEYEVTPAVLDDDGNETTPAVMGTRSVPDYQGIDQSKMVPLLTAALQEALTKIDDMETRLAALESN